MAKGGVLLMLGASSGQRVGIFACMATGGSFTHVRCELRPRVVLSACMASEYFPHEMQMISLQFSSALLDIS